MENLAYKYITKILNVELSDIKELKRFEKGMSNYTYYFKVSNDSYVIRLIGKGANKYIDYYNELNVISVMMKENLTSELIYFDPVTGIKVSKYIEGEIFDFNKTNDLSPLINSLKKMHNINNKEIINYDLINRLTKYQSFIDDDLLDIKYKKIKKWFEEYYYLNYKDEKLVLCHNDLQDANIINSKNNKVYFIDFEYAAYNDLYYDLASFEEDAYLVYEAYFNKRIDNKAMNHIDFFKVYQSLQWYLVASYKDSIGFSKDTNYDFDKLKQYFLDNATNVYKSILKRG